MKCMNMMQQQKYKWNTENLSPVFMTIDGRMNIYRRLSYRGVERGDEFCSLLDGEQEGSAQWRVQCLTLTGFL